jgi:cytochrome c oxidase cbb3-type subunit 2
MREERKVAATRRLGGWAVGLGAALLLAYSPALAAQDTTKGKATYVAWCAGCHGDLGDGLGYAAEYMQPRPRDFTGAVYKIRSTASGQIPTDADIMRAIDEGLPERRCPPGRIGCRRATVATCWPTSRASPRSSPTPAST